MQEKTVMLTLGTEKEGIRFDVEKNVREKIFPQFRLLKEAVNRAIAKVILNRRIVAVQLVKVKIIGESDVFEAYCFCDDPQQVPEAPMVRRYKIQCTTTKLVEEAELVFVEDGTPDRHYCRG
jgi:hypothetical protein